MALTCALTLGACIVFSAASHATAPNVGHGPLEMQQLKRDGVATLSPSQTYALSGYKLAYLRPAPVNETYMAMLPALGLENEFCKAADFGSVSSAQLAVKRGNTQQFDQKVIWAHDDIYPRSAIRRHVVPEFHSTLSFGMAGKVPGSLSQSDGWLGKSSSSSESADLLLAQLALIDPDEGSITAPELAKVDVTPKGNKWQIDLVWIPISGPFETLFVIELVTIPSAPDGKSKLVAFEETQGSAATILVDQVPVGLAWRVSTVAVDRSQYAAGVWTDLSPGTDLSKADTALAPVGRVTIRVGTADMPARQLATELARGLGAGGIWVHLEEVALVQTESTVAYRYAADAELASGVADYLPVLGPGDAIRQAELLAAPGEVVVTLVGGPNGVEGAD